MTTPYFMDKNLETITLINSVLAILLQLTQENNYMNILFTVYIEVQLLLQHHQCQYYLL